MNLANAPEWALEMLTRERVARLAFMDDGDHPRVLPVTFCVFDEAIWTAIDDKPKRTAEPARIRYLRRRPDAALVVDFYDDDWSRLRWVQVTGTVEVLEARDNEPALEALAAKYAQYAERTPPGPLLRLAPDRGLCWRAYLPQRSPSASRSRPSQ
jgi:PPOX class probable F420-dependent enzyme